MIVISEPTALFTTPFFLTIGNNLVSILNETGTIFVPFILVLIISWGKARAMGDDEGAPAIMAFKIVEANFYIMFLLLITCVLPYGDDTPEFRFKQYACSGVPSIISGVSHIDDLKPNTSFGALYGNHNPSLLFGLVHELSTAFSNTAIGTLNCAPGQNRSEVISTFSSLETKPATQNAIRSFHKTCYKPAVSRIDQLLGSGSTMTVDFSKPPFNSPEAFGFSSEPLTRAYAGTISAESGTSLPLTMQTDDKWPNQNNKNALLSCVDAVYDIQRSIQTDLNDVSMWAAMFQDDFDDYVDDMLGLLNSNPNEGVTRADAEREIYQRAYNNSASGWENPFIIGHMTAIDDPTDRQFLNDVAQTTSDLVYVTTSGYMMQANGDLMQPNGTIVDRQGRQQAPNSNTEMLMAGFGYFGTIWANVTKTIEARTYVRTAPVVASLVQGCILGFGGLILVLSGLSTKILMHIVLFYIAATTAPLFINLGVVFDTYITYVMQWFGAHVNFLHASSQNAANLVGTTLILGLPVGWTVLLQLVGVYVSNQLDSAEGASGAGAEETSKLMQKSMQSMTNVFKKVANLPARFEKLKAQRDQEMKDLKVAVKAELTKELSKSRRRT